MSEQQPKQNNDNSNETQPKQPANEEPKPVEQLDDAQLDEEIRVTRQKLRDLIQKRRQIRRQKCKAKKCQPPEEDEQGEYDDVDPGFSQWGQGYPQWAPPFWGPPGQRKHRHGHHGGHKHKKHDKKQWGQYPPFFFPWGQWEQWGQQPGEGSSEERPYGPPGHRGPPCDKKGRGPPQGHPPQRPPHQGPPHQDGPPPQGPPQQRRGGPRKGGRPHPEWCMYGFYPGPGYQDLPQDGSSSSGEEESNGEYSQQDENGNGYYGPDW